MVWNFEEPMVAASRAGKAVVTGNEELFSPQGRKTPHVTLKVCFACRGNAPPPLLVLAGPQCALQELASLHGRSLWLSVNHSGWVDRVIFWQWCQWSAFWMAEIRALWRLDPEEPVMLVLDNAPTRGNLLALQLLVASHIDGVTLSTHLMHTMQPGHVCRARALKPAHCRWPKK
jgi:hypothetical protein